MQHVQPGQMLRCVPQLVETLHLDHSGPRVLDADLGYPVQQLSLDAVKDTRCHITQLRPLEFVPILRQLREDLLDFLI